MALSFNLGTKYFHLLCINKNFGNVNSLYQIRKYNVLNLQTHEKLCICDRKYYINGSFNFLSYSGEEKNNGFRNEGSTYSENRKLIDTVIKMRFGE